MWLDQKNYQADSHTENLFMEIMDRRNKSFLKVKFVEQRKAMASLHDVI